MNKLRNRKIRNKNLDKSKILVYIRYYQNRENVSYLNKNNYNFLHFQIFAIVLKEKSALNIIDITQTLLGCILIICQNI